MSDYTKAECKAHGAQRAAYACQHLNAPAEEAKVGFNAVRDDQGCINAWCDTCEAYLVANGDAWNVQTEALPQSGFFARPVRWIAPAPMV